MKKSNSIKSLIKGVEIYSLNQISDDRGSVLHMLRSDAVDFTSFGECYFSEVSPGSVKAWKRHHKQTQNIAVPIGRIRIVIYDNRINFSTFGKIQEIEIGRPDSYVRVRIPPGLWYGFTCISEIPALLANCSDIPHDPNESEHCSIENLEIPYAW